MPSPEKNSSPLPIGKSGANSEIAPANVIPPAVTRTADELTTASVDKGMQLTRDLALMGVEALKAVLETARMEIIESAKSDERDTEIKRARIAVDRDSHRWKAAVYVSISAAVVISIWACLTYDHAELVTQLLTALGTAFGGFGVKALIDSRKQK
ncbi:MAG: hypothetical protein HY719_03175 [Planctomycetes bacterium]|nr:hypothetical protein [Planctomycetota bacterium]